jgi:hypothetical protein
MKFELRRYVWVIDLIGMLVGAALVGHLVANQIVSTMWPQQATSEYAPPPSRGARAAAPAAIAVRGRRGVPALSNAFVPARSHGIHHHEVSPAFVAALFADLGRLPHGARIVPVTAGDQPVGVRIFGDRDGLLGAIGIASGDLLLEANGFPLTSPSAMLQAYAAFKQSNEAWLVIARGGRRILLTYAIVDSPRAQSWSPRQAAANSSWVP